MAWRPDNWENPYGKESDPLHMGNQEPNYTDYEDGADAMLEALKKSSEYIFNLGGGGWNIFIPDMDDQNH